MRAGSRSVFSRSRISAFSFRIGHGGALQDVLPVQMAQFDVRHILGLHRIDAEARRRGWAPRPPPARFRIRQDGLVDVQQDVLQASSRCAAAPAWRSIEGDLPACSSGGTSAIRDDLPHAQNDVDQQIKIAGKGAFRLSAKTISASFPDRRCGELNRQLQALEVGLVPHIGNFLALPAFTSLACRR